MQYTGKKCDQVQYGLGEAVVLQLTEKIQEIGYRIFINNVFNSPALQAQLLQRKIFSAGTVRANRKTFLFFYFLISIFILLTRRKATEALYIG